MSEKRSKKSDVKTKETKKTKVDKLLRDLDNNVETSKSKVPPKKQKKEHKVVDEPIEFSTKKPSDPLKKFVEKNNPDYIKKRKDYAKAPEVKKRRYSLGLKRRHTNAALLAVLNPKNEIPLKDEEGNKYYVELGRLVKEDGEGKKWLIRADARGKKIKYYPVENDYDLLSEKYDHEITTKNKDDLEKVYEDLKRLFDGDPELEDRLKSKRVIVDTKLDDKDCYWKQLTEDEKQDMLDKIREQIDAVDK